MKGIYLTEEGKKAIEDKIDYLEESISRHPFDEILLNDRLYQKIEILKKILSSAKVLPVEESWTDFYNATSPLFRNFKPTDVEYPNGVIIEKNKQ